VFRFPSVKSSSFAKTGVQANFETKIPQLSKLVVNVHLSIISTKLDVDFKEIKYLQGEDFHFDLSIYIGEKNIHGTTYFETEIVSSNKNELPHSDHRIIVDQFNPDIFIELVILIMKICYKEAEEKVGVKNVTYDVFAAQMANYFSWEYDGYSES